MYSPCSWTQNVHSCDLVDKQVSYVAKSVQLEMSRKSSTLMHQSHCVHKSLKKTKKKKKKNGPKTWHHLFILGVLYKSVSAARSLPVAAWLDPRYAMHLPQTRSLAVTGQQFMPMTPDGN